MSRVRRLSLVLVAVVVIATLAMSTARANDYLDVIRQTIQIVQSEYYREIDALTLVRGALKGIMDAVGDPHTDYMPPARYDEFWQRATGEYVGIGIVYETSEEGVKVLSVLEGSPAALAGIRPGDILLAAGGKSLKGMEAPDIKAIFSTKDVVIELSVERDGSTLTLNVAAAWLRVPSAEWRMLPDNVGYIRIVQFGEGLAEDLAKAHGDLAGAAAIVLDLRDCPGGLLSSVIEAAGFFVPEGPLVRLKSRAGEERIMESTGPGPQVPLAVLVNRRTASAAEILAGAIQDYESGTVMGNTTFGKGVAQSIYQLGQELGGIRLTSMKFFTPLGRDYDGTGLTPDIWVDPVSIRYTDLRSPLVVTDRQLQIGARGSDVTLLQDALRVLGFFNRSSTGYFGPVTAAAVVEFQKKAGLPQTGIADGTTLKILNDFHLRTPIYGDGMLEAAVRLLGN